MTFLHWLWETLSADLEILLLAALPIIELKGAIPVGLSLGMDLPTAFALSYIGSTLPCLPILLLYTAVLNWMRKHPPFDRFAHWISERLAKRRGQIDRYGFVGLLIFVAIPLPGTGVWTGSGIAALLELPRGRSIIAIAVGNLIAGLIITAISFPVLG